MNPLESFSADTNGCFCERLTAPRWGGAGRPYCPVCGHTSISFNETQQMQSLEGWRVVDYGDSMHCIAHGWFPVAEPIFSEPKTWRESWEETWRDREPML